LSFFLVERTKAVGTSSVKNEKVVQKKYELPEPGDISEIAIKMRKRFVLVQTASNTSSHKLLSNAIKQKTNLLNGKHLIPIASAVLSSYPDNKLAKDVILSAMCFRGRDSMFTKIRAAQAFHHLRHVFNKQEISQFEQEMAAYTGFFGYGTENHIAMKRIAGLLFGQSFPDAQFHHGLTGAEVMKKCMSYMAQYGRAVYGSSNSEFLSHIYFPVHIEAWADAYQYAKDPAAKVMAKALLDWFFANAALNFHHRFINGAIHRGSYGGIEKYRRHALSRLLWMYGANTEETTQKLSSARMPPAVISVAMTDYIPHRAILNILSKQVKLPFAICQACANKAYLEKFYQNKMITKKVPSKYPYEKSLFRNVYIGENYAMGDGNLRIALESYSSIPTTVAFTASWRSQYPYNYLFTKKNGAEKKKNGATG